MFFHANTDCCIPLVILLSTRSTNSNLIYRAINVACLKRKNCPMPLSFLSRNAIRAATFHFSPVICRINTITFLSALGWSYFLHQLKFPSSHWDAESQIQDMTLWDRWMCTINTTVHFNASRVYMHTYSEQYLWGLQYTLDS